ncbi:MAG: hypothetical protein U0797_13530 [Gemmataceae bacterium]
MSHSARVAITSLTLLAAAAAADQPKPRDVALYETLKDVINRGADLYNAGEPAACYYLYQGSLMTIKPALAGRPELEKAVAKALAGAEKDPVMWRRSFTLRDALDKVRSEVNPSKKDRDKAKATEGDKDAENLKAPKKEGESKEGEKKAGEKKAGDKKDAGKKEGDKKDPDKDAG